MNAILEQINSTGKIFVEFALPMLVQSSVLILILLLADFALRKKVRAVFRYGIWMLVLIKLVLPASLSSPLSLGYFLGDGLAYVDISRTTTETAQTAPAIVSTMINPPRIEANSDTSTIAPTTPTIEPAVTGPFSPPIVPVASLSWQGAVFLIWLAVVMAMGLLLLQRAFFVRGLVAQAKEANGFMNDTLESCRERIRVKRKIRLKVSPNAASPAVCGLFRPVILVPQNLTSNLSASQLQAVLLHELAHIRRGDLWVNLAQTVLQIIHFYNPLLWVANCIIRRTREQAVDEMVLVAMGAKARQYPQALVDVAKLAFKRPALSLRLIGVVESKSALAGRIKHILNRPMPKKAKLGILGLAVVIITAAILLPMAACTPGPPSLVIKGVVKDAQTGKPIAGARVFDDGYGPKPNWEQIKADERSEWGAITNSAGEYSFLTWPEHHSIKVEAPGYKAKRQSLYDGHFVFNTKDEETFDFALEPEEVIKSSGPIKVQFNGVTIDLDLLGICEYPSEGKQWWRTDGSPLEKAPYDKSGDKFKPPKKSERYKDYQFVLCLDCPSGTSLKWDIPDSNWGASTNTLFDENGKRIYNLRLKRAGLPKDKISALVRIGVAADKWKTIITYTPEKAEETYTLTDGAVAFGVPYEKKGETLLPVVHNYNYQRFATRVVALDNSGREYQAGGSTDRGDVLASHTCRFSLSLKDIKEFQFQTQPYQWFEFRNVSLRPGVKTDVQVGIKVGSVGSKVPAEMIGTWFFDNPGGDDEQMAIFPDGRVVVLYSNGHKDQTKYINGFIELAEHDGTKCKMDVEEKGTLVQYFDSGGSVLIGRRWKRIDSQPHTDLLRLLTGPDSSKTDVPVEGEEH